MIKNSSLLGMFAAFALVSLPFTTHAAPATARQWNVNNTNSISYAEPYELYNTTAQIGYENRTFGVDLGWVSNGGLFEFLRQAPPGTRDHRKGPIPPDANVAIYNSKTRRYLKYYDRSDTKAELEWSNTPVYEWQLQDQSASGGRVHFALFNSRVKKYLVHKVQNYGINLGWLNESAPAPQSFSLALRAQPITQGWVPYLGPFGQNTRGNLLTVQNASQNATLLFVKPGKSTTDCSDPNATVRVAPRGMMTPDQMKTLYGSASPRLPINFLACLTTPTPQSISLTYLNLTYKLDP
jgi:hypothetical protein